MSPGSRLSHDDTLLFHSMETKGESLPSPISSGSSGKKSSRKEEQYRLMFSELEKYVVAHSSNSGKHYSVLECLMQVIVGGWFTVHGTRYSGTRYSGARYSTD